MSVPLGFLLATSRQLNQLFGPDFLAYSPDLGPLGVGFDDPGGTYIAQVTKRLGGPRQERLGVRVGLEHRAERPAGDAIEQCHLALGCSESDAHRSATSLGGIGT